jgi:hypothetical protein
VRHHGRMERDPGLQERWVAVGQWPFPFHQRYYRAAVSRESSVNHQSILLRPAIIRRPASET